MIEQGIGRRMADIWKRHCMCDVTVTILELEEMKAWLHELTVFFASYQVSIPLILKRDVESLARWVEYDNKGGACK